VATYNHDDSLERTSRDTQRRLADASAELAESRHRAQSGDGFVSATVNGHGSLLDLKIVPGALRRSPPGVLGPQILSAIQEARADAGELNRARLAEVLDLPPAADTPATDTPATTPQRGRVGGPDRVTTTRTSVRYRTFAEGSARCHQCRRSRTSSPKWNEIRRGPPRERMPGNLPVSWKQSKGVWGSGVDRGAGLPVVR